MLEWANTKAFQGTVGELPGIVDKSTKRQLCLSMSHYGENDKVYEYADTDILARFDCSVDGYFTSQEIWSVELTEVRRRRRASHVKKSLSRESLGLVRAAFTMLTKRPDDRIQLIYGPQFLKAEEEAE